MAWDVFYLVLNENKACLKFGISSGDPRPRLGEHRRAGYSTVLRLLTGLPEAVAPDLERLVLAALQDAGETPIHGREYYGLTALPVILDLVDNYPGVSSML